MNLLFLFKVAYFATQSIDSPMAVILDRGSLFNIPQITHTNVHYFVRKILLEGLAPVYFTGVPHQVGQANERGYTSISGSI